MYKKGGCTCKVVVLLNKPIAFLKFLLQSPSSLLKLPIAIGESSITWNRSLRAKTEGGISGGQLPSIFHNSTWRLIMRAERHIMRTPKKTPKIHVLGTLGYRFFYLYDRYFTVNAR